MITMGIAGSVSLKWLTVLISSILFIMLSALLLNIIFIFFKARPLYETSFTEGNSLHTLEITTTADLKELSERYDLVSFTKSKDSVIYRFANSNRNEIMNVANKLQDNNQVKNITFNRA